MKIYRTITIKAILGILFATLFFAGMFAFGSEEGISSAMNIQFWKTLLTFAFIIFYGVFGDAAFLRMNSANPGYKYFRSIPDAYARFRKHCLSLDIAFLAIGAILLVIAWSDGFERTFSVVTFTAYMLVFAITHFAVAFIKFNSRAYFIIKALLSGVIGMSCAVFGFSISDFAFISMSPTTGFIVCTVITVIALSAVILSYSRLERKWNED